MAKSYPDKATQHELRILLLRVNITPTKSIMNRIKSMSAKQADNAKKILVRVAKASELARSANPEGKRSTTRQLQEWDRWMSHAGEEVTPEALGRFMNLDTKSANQAIMALRWIVWGEQDSKGRTTPMRAARGLVTEKYTPADSPPPQPRRISWEAL